MNYLHSLKYTKVTKYVKLPAYDSPFNIGNKTLATNP